MHDITRPIEVPVVAVAADPAMPDAVTGQRQLALLAAAGAEVATHTLAGANHLIHDWQIVDGFLTSLG